MDNTRSVTRSKTVMLLLVLSFVDYLFTYLLQGSTERYRNLCLRDTERSDRRRNRSQCSTSLSLARTIYDSVQPTIQLPTVTYLWEEEGDLRKGRRVPSTKLERVKSKSSVPCPRISFTSVGPTTPVRPGKETPPSFLRPSV